MVAAGSVLGIITLAGVLVGIYLRDVVAEREVRVTSAEIRHEPVVAGS